MRSLAKRSATVGPVRNKRVTAGEDIAPVRYLASSAVLAALLERDAEAIKALRVKGPASHPR
jgi:hypothetical protein